MPKIVDHDTERTKILQKSHKWLVKNGYQSGAMRNLLSHLKLSPGAFYHYFPNKEAYLGALVTHLAKISSETISKDAPRAGGITELLKWAEANETLLRSQLLLLIDLYREGSLGRGKLTRSQPVDEFLNIVECFFPAEITSNSAERDALIRFALTYLVGVLVVTLWAPEPLRISKFTAFARSFASHQKENS